LLSIITTPPGPITKWSSFGPAAGDGQVVQDRPPVPLQWSQEVGGASLPRRPAPPGNGVLAGPEPQCPAGRHGRQPAEDQADLGLDEVAEQPAGSADAKSGGQPPG